MTLRDFLKEKLPGGGGSVNLDGSKLEEQGLISHSKKSGGLSMDNGHYLKPCWDKPNLGKFKFST